MKKTLGIAIPCHTPYLGYLERLLDSIKNSTVLPDSVSISISSFSGKYAIGNYPFEVIVRMSEQQKGPSTNRNDAAKLLDTDIISFIDADDLMHCQRTEYLLAAFATGSEAVVHDYQSSKEVDLAFCARKYPAVEFLPGYIDMCAPDCPFPSNAQLHRAYAVGHMSVTREIFRQFKYDQDEAKVFRREDSVYAKELVANGHSICLINNKLSLYIK